MRRRSRGTLMQGARYCGPECLEQALLRVLRRSQRAASPAGLAFHRIPLGLLLLSRQQLTGEQLRTALKLQRESSPASSGKNTGVTNRKIGFWLQDLGFVTEHQVTAALARQWSCPMLRSAPKAMAPNRFPAIPNLLLESFQMIPVEFVEASGRLLMAFSEGIDYTVLYAIERMLGYRTEACLLRPSILQKSLENLGCRTGSGDVIFDRIKDAGECAEIIGNYCTMVRAEEVRVAQCGEHFWVRLERAQKETVTLLMRGWNQARPSALSAQ
jgi:hypothetical protein